MCNSDSHVAAFVVEYDGDSADYERYCAECKDNLELPLTDEGQLNKRKSLCADSVNEVRDSKGKLPAYALLGGYPYIYYDKDGAAICPDCANKLDWSGAFLQAYDLYMEGPPAQCENCYSEIESAYGDPDEDDTVTETA